VARPWRTPVLVAALFALVVTEASAAPPQNLGQNPFSSEGGCSLCSAVQLSNSAAPNPYELPANGVLVRSGFYVGPFTEAGDFAQARVFRRTGGAGVTVINQGEKHFLNGLSAGFHGFFERIPGKAGDVLGGRFDTSPFINSTPAIFATGSATDEAGVISSPTNPEPGQNATSTPVANRRVNVTALFEPDEDGDGYGDVSQDLCPGSPHAADACTGALFGSAFQGPYTTVGDCTYECMRIQTAVAGASTAVPAAGVVVRWRLLAAKAGAYRIRTIAPSGGPSYAVLGSSAAETVEASAYGKITTFQTRLPISAGGYVGLVPPRFTTLASRSPELPGSTYVLLDDAPDGGEVALGGYTPVAGEALYDADIEPDADHDGYGDVSQDSCPGDASTHGACPLATAIVDKFPPTVRCQGKKATLVGKAGKDVLKGTNHADVIVALAGDDTIKARGGNDLVCAGKGKDTVLGGTGEDRLFGEAGIDTLRGGPGKDKLAGGAGKDLQKQ